MAVIVDIITEASFPPELLLYVEGEFNSISENTTLFLIAAILIISLVIVYIGLYMWKSWARIFFIILMVIGYSVTPIFSSIIVSSIWADILHSISTVLFGIIIGMMYFSVEIDQKFKRT